VGIGVQIPSSFSFIEERGQPGFDLTVVEQESFHGSGKGLTQVRRIALAESRALPIDNLGGKMC